MGRLFLLDAMAILYRSHFAMMRYPRMSSRGVNTSAIYGFTNSLLEVIRAQRPTHMGVAFDVGGVTLRHEQYAEYKAQREAAPEAITDAIPYVDRLLEVYGIPALRCQRYEADDVIGTLAHKAAGEAYDVYMVTPDKDFAQLVNERVFLYRPPLRGRDGQLLGPQEVCANFGLRHPRQMIDLLALQGDAVDNIPGVPGVGPKSAQRLLAEYGDLEGVLSHASSIKGLLGDRIARYADQARLSYDLARIRTDAPVAWRAEDFVLEPPNKQALMGLFSELEFRTLSQRLFGTLTAEATKKKEKAPPPTSEPAFSNIEMSLSVKMNPVSVSPSLGVPIYKELRDEKALKTLWKRLSQVGTLAFYLHTEPRKRRRNQIKGIALAAFETEAYYVPLPEDENELKEALKPFRALLANERILKIGEAIKHDALILEECDCTLSPPYVDLTLIHYLLDAESNHQLEALALNYLPNHGFFSLPYKDKSKGLPMALRAQSALQLLALRAPLMAALEKTPALHELYEKMELPLMAVLMRMEKKGVYVNTDTLVKLAQEYEGDKQAIARDIYALANREFNISSPKQVGEVLFEELQLIDKPKRTKSGGYATDEDYLASLSNKHPVIKKILRYRYYQKMISTYLKALPQNIYQADGRIHTDFQQSVTATGRLSSNHPNLQNIPIRGDEGKRIRRAFCAQGTSMHVLSVDYSQIELRIMASFSEDKGLIAAFCRDEDIHNATACKIFKTTAEKVTADQRRMAKSANFGIIYGISPYGLSRNLHIPLGEAKALITTYFNEFPKVKTYIEAVIGRAREQGYVETLRGRRRYLRDIDSRNATLRHLAERNAVNAPIQGSAADLIKEAMIQIDQRLQKSFKRSAIILQIHDELVFETHKDEACALKEMVVACMEGVSGLSVPIKVSVGMGKDWAEAHS